MAEAVSSGEYECPVCHEEFTEPKLLPCTHRMCKKCVVSCLETKGEGGCPVCNTPIRFAAGAKNDDVTALVDDLPTDMATLTLVESKRILSGDHVCGSCDDNAAATSFCLNCSVMLCVPCIKVHNKIPATRDHVLEELKTLTAERLAAIRKSPCESHPDRPVELYCPDHQTLICFLCATSKHCACSGVLGIAEVAKKERIALQEQCDRLLFKEMAITDVIDELELEVEDGQEHFKSTKDDISMAFDRLTKSLEKRRLQIMETVQSKEDKFMAERKAARHHLDQLRAEVAQACSLQQLLESLPDSALVSMLKKLKQRLYSLEAQSHERHDEEDDQSKVSFEKELTSLEREIANFGQVVQESFRVTEKMEETDKGSLGDPFGFDSVTTGRTTFLRSGGLRFGETITFGQEQQTAMKGFASGADSGSRDVKFKPPSGSDIMNVGGVNKWITTYHQCISAMEEYENMSLEELRMEYYAANPKGKQEGKL